MTKRKQNTKHQLEKCKTCARWITSDFHLFEPFCVERKKCNYYSIEEANKRPPAQGRGYARSHNTRPRSGPGVNWGHPDG